MDIILRTPSSKIAKFYNHDLILLLNVCYYNYFLSQHLIWQAHPQSILNYFSTLLLAKELNWVNVGGGFDSLNTTSPLNPKKRFKFYLNRKTQSGPRKSTKLANSTTTSSCLNFFEHSNSLKGPTYTLIESPLILHSKNILTPDHVNRLNFDSVRGVSLKKNLSGRLKRRSRYRKSLVNKLTKALNFLGTSILNFTKVRARLRFRVKGYDVNRLSEELSFHLESRKFYSFAKNDLQSPYYGNLN